MKRMIPLLALVVVLCLFAAPEASASCYRCKISTQECVYVYLPGHYYCQWNPATGWCDVDVECGFGNRPAEAPLASEYRVEAVEVLDETPAPEQTAQVNVLEQKID
ncbi:MAG TPA: hypothetical protein VEK57_29175 [Thermoanaerobaculia bacterium]|nr:hypothetical protein [Thermoanaerobaculia bacterium]